MKPTLDLHAAIAAAGFSHFDSETGYNLAMTGSRRGMTPEQIIAFAAFISEKFPSTLLHGCCVGSDEHADKAYRILLRANRGEQLDLDYWKEHIHGYPPTDQSLMMKMDPRFIHLERPRPYLIRNKNMVNNADAVIGFPDSPFEIQRSGTWSTVRYAVSKAKPTLLILPSGAFCTYPPELK